MSSSKKRAAEAVPEGKKKKKRKTKYHQDDEALDMELGLNTLFKRMDNQLLADCLAQKLSRFGNDLSPVELSDLTVPANSIQDSTAFQEDRTLKNLPAFLARFSGGEEGLAKAPKKKASPHTLIVAGAGLRAADVVRAVRKFSTEESTVAKLFAKHIKVEEQITFLKNRKTGIGVGTPARLNELIDIGALSLDHLERVVVDASHVDQKKRGIMDMKDTLMPLATFLTRPELKERYSDNGKPLALLFY
ncbi:uncharacterized protein UV8b_04088 [Ustilaginoidea virens]|uniref:DNA/RNA helicase, DEAD/DEAH box type n=1 Tax=Ustilaginoidea virens TaxID=1159556 RepID=A0A8E5MHD3_USTVR|nr:uncharacterized protein UV8b_04088 [Ustilaginoidea virens]QUC19847.1 hypothetical protein UV8b_04088 [Ustilaginoidea virens]